jgi:hypothetical protein
MGYIPLFLTITGACLLFFLTVKNTMRNKLNLQKELLSKLAVAHPELGLTQGEIVDPEKVMKQWKKDDSPKKIPHESLEIIRELKVNRLQYNQLIRKAPYNWVANLSGYQPI